MVDVFSSILDITQEMHKLNMQGFINSRIGLGAAFAFGRYCPPLIGYQLAQIFAARIAARQDLSMVRAVRANQWVVSQGSLTSQQLDQRVRDTFKHTSHCLFDLYHNLQNPTAMLSRTHWEPVFDQLIAASQQGKSGMVIVGIHVSNFDLAMHAATLRGMKAMVLSYPNPGKSYQWQNQIRMQAGMEIIPASPEAVRQAIKRLQAGEVVATGIDRPFLASEYRPRFFGLPAALPVAHVFMALKARVPVVVVAATTRANGDYDFHASAPVMMQPHPDRETEILQNAESVLRIAEGYIRRAPHQWAMFYPVWPEVLDELP